MSAMNDPVIFDFGMNNGDDTEFYLKKGFRVVAVDANPELCTLARERFASPIAAGRLAVIHAAVAAKPGTVELFLNDDVTGWSTANPAWQASRTALQTTARSVKVPAITLAEIVGEHGLPYYLKLDIQGAEVACLEGLVALAERPAYVSVSAGTDVLMKDALRHVRTQLDLLARCGYNRFQIVAQQDTKLQSCPNPAREGVYVDHRFNHGSSGLFGRELPENWVSLEEAAQEHSRIVRDYQLAGHSRSPAGWFKRVPSERIKYGLDKLFWRGLGWYDTHAKRA